MSPRCCSSTAYEVHGTSALGAYAAVAPDLVLGAVAGHDRLPQADHARRGPLCRDPARNGGQRRLADAPPGRPQVFREAGAAVLGHRRGVHPVRRTPMDGAAVERAHRPPGHPRHLVHGAPPVGRGRRPGWGRRARRQPALRADRPRQYPGHGRLLLPLGGGVRLRPGAARRRQPAREPQLHARRLARGGAGHVEQGPDRPGAAGHRPDRLFALAARLFLLAQTASRSRSGAVCRRGRALVRRRLHRQSGVRAILLHPRAFPALPHQGSRPLPADLVFPAHPHRRHGALADRAVLGALVRGAARALAALPAAALPAGLDRGGVLLLLGVRLQARLLHPAAVPGAGGLDRLAPRAAGRTRSARPAPARLATDPAGAGLPRALAAGGASGQPGGAGTALRRLRALAAGRLGLLARGRAGRLRFRRAGAASRRPALSGSGRIAVLPIDPARPQQPGAGELCLRHRPEDPRPGPARRPLLQRRDLRPDAALLPRAHRDIGRLPG